MIPGQYKKEKYELKIGSNNAIDFDFNDPVFLIQGPILEVSKNLKSCDSCKKDLSKIKY